MTYEDELYFYYSYNGLWKILDAEMKEAHSQGVTNKKKEREPITSEEEERMWKEGLLGAKSAKTLMNTVYYYNGKLFGLRAGEHRSLRLNDIEIKSGSIIFRENSSKTFHGGIKDLKKKPRVIRHICHNESEQHERCLVLIYKRYLELVNSLSSKDKAFYFQPYNDRYSFKNAVVGVHSLDNIVPNLCKAIGIEKKTSHCLRVTLATKLFNENVDEKLIRERTGHKSDSLFIYEKASKEKEETISNILGPVEQKSKNDTSVKLQDISNPGDLSDIDMPLFDFDLFGSDDLAGEAVGKEPTNIPSGWSHYSDAPINISGNCNVTIHQYKK